MLKGMISRTIKVDARLWCFLPEFMLLLTLRLDLWLFSSLEYSEIRNSSSVATAELFSTGQQELVDHTTFGKDLKLTYAINHAKKLRNLHTD